MRAKRYHAYRVCLDLKRMTTICQRQQHVLTQPPYKVKHRISRGTCDATSCQND